MNIRTTVISFLLMLGLVLTVAAQEARTNDESISSPTASGAGEADDDVVQCWHSARVPARDAHLRSADFLDVENFPEIIFRSDQLVVIGEVDYPF